MTVQASMPTLYKQLKKLPGFLLPFGRRHPLLRSSCSRPELGLPHGRLTGT
jgi:hypothetical protein